MLEKLEMHDIQDKQRLLDEMNETREAVNSLAKKLDDHLKGHQVARATKVHDPDPVGVKPKAKAKK